MWAFGLADTSHHTPALGYMEIVAQPDAATLLPIIQAHVALGTVVHSGQWAAYNQVSSLSNVAVHSTVNHSITFVDPTTHTHKHTIESYWARVKRTIPDPRGDAYYATTSERVDYGLRTGDLPLETDWPDIVRRKYAFKLVFRNSP